VERLGVSRSRAVAAVVAVIAVIGLVPAIHRSPATADAPGFTDSIVFSGLELPTSIQFASDGRVFVAEKAGVVKVFDDLADTTPDVFVDLRTQVHNFWDRGLLGMALAPEFPAVPYVYVLYTHDAEIGSTAPRWGSADQSSDPCPDPPGATGEGCVVSGRLSRFLAAGNEAAGTEQVLIEDWCAQYPSHTIGDLRFGPDGSLYVSAGDGASFNFVDYGQIGGNACNDYPGGPSIAPPESRGGALRAQKVVTDGVPVSLDGAVLRVDPATGDGMPSNPFASSADPNARRIVASGLRNPFRLALRPGTSELYVGEVGWTQWEEINVVADPADDVAENFGWPCHEGFDVQPGYQALGVDVCEDLYAAGTAVDPVFTYLSGTEVVPGDGCETGNGSSISGIAFNDDGNNYPAEYDGALFFADYSRACIWVIRAGPDDRPDPTTVAHFMTAANPAFLTTGPEGDLWYADIIGGDIHRISYATPGSTVCPAGQFVAEYFNNMGLSGAPVLSRCEATIANEWGSASPAAGVNADQFSVRWTASPVFTAGTYEFSVTADDGVRLYVDGEVVIDEWKDQAPTTYTASRALTAGAHEVRVEYYEAALGAVARLSWANVSGPPGGGDCPAGQFLAEYFNNMVLSGVPVLSRCEAVIDNDWGNGSPGPGVQADEFSVRWTGSPVFAAGTYQFSATADDGVRVSVDGEVVIDEWKDQAPTTYTAARSLTAGAHPVQVEYYENGLGAVARFSWVSTGGGDNQAPTATITTPGILTTWKVGDTLSFSGSATDTEDGSLPSSALSWRVSMLHCPAACHEHVIQTFTGVGGGSIVAPDHEYPSRLQFELTAVDSEGSQHTATTVIDPQTATLRFESVPSGLNLAHGSVQVATPFERTVIVGSSNSIGASTPQTLAGTTYDWTSWSDGGARNHNVVAAAGVTTLTANFTPRSGDPGGGDCPVGQFLAEYFNNMVLSGAPVLSRCEAVINNDWGNGSPGPGVNADGFSVRWTGAPVFEAGAHVFSATADDGVRVWVDGVSLIDAWKDQGPTTYTGSRTLTAGAHDVRVEFYENGGGAVARLSWVNFGDPGGDPGGGDCPVGQFLAEYFNNMVLSGAPVLSRCEAVIDNAWGNGSPGPGVNADGFSVRWTGAPVFAAGTYQFSATADDGVRVSVDGVSLIAAWLDQAPTTYTATRTLTAGAHDVVVEYYENALGAVARFSWSAA
jgi:glucose/arabinose dehydrogenase